MASTDRPAHHLVWKRAEVAGRPAMYGVTGTSGPTVVFLHGWALAHHSYKRALNRVAQLGARVLAPALPGFGGTHDLPDRAFSMPGYARWVNDFLDAVGVEEQVILVGHSFGGGVAIQTAHDHGERVRTLVLVNSIGGSAWTEDRGVVRSMAERPLWDWGIHFPQDVMPLRQLRRVLPVILEDAVPNLLRNARAVWRVGQLARRADLTEELEALKDRGLPVVVLWGDQDRVITKESFDALCAAIGSEGEVVPGAHSWLLADPDAFGEVMTNYIPVADLARAVEDAAPKRRGQKSA